jgi:hypothetical protein
MDQKCLPKIGSYVTVTGTLSKMISITAGNGPYQVVSSRYDDESQYHVVRISGPLGSAAVFYPNRNIHQTEPPNTNWRETGF